MFKKLSKIKDWLDDQPDKPKKVKKPKEVIAEFELDSVPYFDKNVSKIMRENAVENIKYKANKKEVENWKHLQGYIYKYEEYEVVARLVKEPKNNVDKKAIAVRYNNMHVGYIPRKWQDFIKKNNVHKINILINGGAYKLWFRENDKITGERGTGYYFINSKVYK